MKTRVSKIARLSHKTREELNLRLLNGQLGAPLLQWLNELPDTKETLADLFAGKLITRQNLSEWRHGGYQDWLFHQRRQEHFQQLNEQGGELKIDEGAHDSFENFARILLAELTESLNQARQIANTKERWQRLREISRDLARLQHGFNHSRRVELAFKKWNYEAGYDEDINAAAPGSAGLSVGSSAIALATAEALAESDVPPASPSDPNETQTNATTPENSAINPGSVAVSPFATPSPPAVQPSPTESRQKNSSGVQPSTESSIIASMATAASAKIATPTTVNIPMLNSPQGSRPG